jgi:hypothetical protein
MSNDEKKVSRRAALKVLGIAPLALTQQQTPQPPRQGHEQPNQPARDTRQPASQPQRRFFTAKELRTVRVLADDIIPRDAKSGSATEAGVPEFMDFNLSVEETTADTRIAFRGGLRWMDKESRKRFGTDYASATAAQRHLILDDISWPENAAPALSHGVSFFARFRDMVASGFFSSPLGYKDLEYKGHVFVPEWHGCPPEALHKLGVSYE